MRKLFGVILFLCFSTSAFALGFQWDANPAADAVFKYTLKQANALGGPFTAVATVLPTACTATTCVYTMPTAPAPGVYYFHVTATNVWQESGPSNIVNTPPAGPALPKNFIIVLTIAPDGTPSITFMSAEEFFRAG
jgi:hypothetical protein